MEDLKHANTVVMNSDYFGSAPATMPPPAKPSISVQPK
jgi:hypothetical protein